ncbi:MAG: glycosyltransferase family 2 protein [Patescibacteria group bacterium]|nr:glycosyltransferase family 2 protein [Patescibacteria group bacterium]
MQKRNGKRPAPDLSVVIVSYNTARITVDCITSLYESLQGRNLHVETVVVDNGSTDGSIEEIKRLKVLYPEIRLIEAGSNLGFGKANNLGVRHVSSGYLLLLNSDVIVLENAVEKLYRFYRAHEAEYQFVGGKLFNTDMTPQSSAGRFFTLPVAFAFLLLFGDRLGITRSSPMRTVQTDWVSGACIMTHTRYYQAVGGFDEGIFMYMEEVDLLYRAAKKGYRTGFFPDASFIHIGSASSNKTYPVLQAFRGLLYFYRKHYGPISLLLLKRMLQLKSLLGWGIGFLTGNTYLKKTYEEAFRITRMD